MLVQPRAFSATDAAEWDLNYHGTTRFQTVVTLFTVQRITTRGKYI